ncbi:MAG: TonB-dependent receptor [Verrucomicrobiota bacterium JB022]|nr:TonB-dependent receptor [Verrucomicrobiota bacterium JB022]
MYSFVSYFSTRSLYTVALVSSLAATASLSGQGTSSATSEEVYDLQEFAVTASAAQNSTLVLEGRPETGSRLGLSNWELPASVSVISQDLMQQRGLRTAVEAVEAAVGMTGGTYYGSIPSYTTRGFSGNSVTVMRDGIRQNTASQSSRTIDSFLLGGVEILKGPAGLMFGEGAIGGAVNYLSREPLAAAAGELQASVGSWDTYRLGVGWGGPLSLGGEQPLTTWLGYSHQETAGYVDRSRERYDAGALALGWQVSDRFRLTLQANYLEDWNQSYYGTPVIYDAVLDTTDPDAVAEVRAFNSSTDRMINPRIDERARRTNYNIFDNYAASRNAFVRLRAEWELTPEVALRNETYVATQELRWRNLETNVWNPVTELVDRRSFLHIYRDDVLVGDRLDVTTQNDLFGRSNRLLVGLSYEHNDMGRGGTPDGYPTTLDSVSLLDPVLADGPGDRERFQKTSDVLVETTAVYLEDAFELTDTITLVGGLRYDWIELERETLNSTTPVYEKTYRPVTGRGGVVWKVGSHVNLYGSYSRAAEPVTQLVSFTSARDTFSLQKGRQYEVGAKGTFFDERLGLTLALFDIEKNDLLRSTIDPDTGERLSQQIGAQNARGVELAAAFTPAEAWQLELNLAYTDAWYGDYAENLGSGIIDRTDQTPSNIPEWVGSISIRHQLTEALTLQGGLRYVGERFANTNNSVVAEEYVLCDLAVSYRWRQATFTLRGRNLLDETYEPVAGTTMRRLGDPRSVEFATQLRF